MANQYYVAKKSLQFGAMRRDDLMGACADAGLPFTEDDTEEDLRDKLLQAIEEEENPNDNCLEDMQCPCCGSFGDFLIDVTQSGMTDVSDEGTGYINGDIEWGDEDRCICRDCDHEATVGDFRGKDRPVKPKPAGPRPTYLDLSTGHVSQATMEALERIPAEMGCSVATHKHGAYLIVPPLPYSVAVPDDLKVVLDYARKEGFGLVSLDADGPFSDELPQFDW